MHGADFLKFRCLFPVAVVNFFPAYNLEKSRSSPTSDPLSLALPQLCAHTYDPASCPPASLINRTVAFNSSAPHSATPLTHQLRLPSRHYTPLHATTNAPLSHHHHNNYRPPTTLSITLTLSSTPTPTTTSSALTTAGPPLHPLLGGNALDCRLDLVGMLPPELEELGLLGRVGYLGQ